MARKPNYNFERSQREKNKAAKKAERLQAKAQKLAEKNAGTSENPPQMDDDQPRES